MTDPAYTSSLNGKKYTASPLRMTVAGGTSTRPCARTTEVIGDGSKVVVQTWSGSIPGEFYLYDTKVKNSTDLLERMKKFSVMKPQPEVQIRGDGKSDFESVGRVMYAVQRAGITKVGFITEPSN